jgi:hypothetical protein
MEHTAAKQVNKIVEAFVSSSIEVVVVCRTATVEVMEVHIRVAVAANASNAEEGSTAATVVAGEDNTTTTIAARITAAIGE